MTRPPRGPGRQIRSVFLSDTHLGCRWSQAESLLAFLREIEPQYLYLVGDIIDGWRLRRRWHWQPVYSRILARLVELGLSGTQVRYTPGNHDAFVREFAHDYGFLEVADSFLHEGADGRSYLVLHGDRFDTVEIRAQWLSVVGALAYDALMWVNGQVNWIRSLLLLEAWQFSARLKRTVKQAALFVSSFEERLARHAREAECDGVICGHVHTPAETTRHGLAYFNTGDWVEHRCALLEYADGTMELVHLPASDCRIAGTPAFTSAASEEEFDAAIGPQFRAARRRVPLEV